MPLYIIEIPGSEFTGFRGGVDFFDGKGSTSSRTDAQRLAEALGYKVSEQIALHPRAETKTEGASQEAPSATLQEPAQEAQATPVSVADAGNIAETKPPKRGHPQARKRK